jgi:hypothetical protein
MVVAGSSTHVFTAKFVSCSHNRRDAACRRNKHTPVGTPPGPNPHRLSPVVGVTVDPPDGSGTKSLCSRLSHH